MQFDSVVAGQKDMKQIIHKTSPLNWSVQCWLPMISKNGYFIRNFLCWV